MAQLRVDELSSKSLNQRSKKLLEKYRDKIDDNLLYAGVSFLNCKYLYFRTRFIESIDVRYIDAFCLYLASAFPDHLRDFLAPFKWDNLASETFNAMFSDIVTSLGKENYGDDYSRGLLTFLEPLEKEWETKSLEDEALAIAFLYDVIIYKGEGSYTSYFDLFGPVLALTPAVDFDLLGYSFKKGRTIVIRSSSSFGKPHSSEKDDYVYLQFGKPKNDGKNIIYLTADRVWELAKDYPEIAFRYMPSAKLLSESEAVKEGEDQNERNKEDFRRYLKQKDTKLAIFTGNGVSIAFGSDGWEALSKTIVDYLHPYYLDDIEAMGKIVGGGKTVMSAIAKSMIDPDKYTNAIYYSIYRKYEDQMHSENTLLRAVSKIKQKRKDCRLFTYNYDEFLEMDYAKLTKGKKLRPVGKDGCEPKKKGDYLTGKNMTVSHLHGFLPFDGPKECQGLILGEEEYQENYKRSKWTWRIQDDVFTDPNSLVLFVGSSLTDAYQLSMIARAHSVTKSRIFALAALDPEKEKEYAGALQYYRKKNIRLITAKDFKELPGALLKLFGLSPSSNKQKGR